MSYTKHTTFLAMLVSRLGFLGPTHGWEFASEVMAFAWDVDRWKWADW